jgi:hypothetical protein
MRANPGAHKEELVKSFTSELCAAVCVLASAVNLYGQSVKATVLGTVSDASAGVITGARVVITETNTNAVRSTDTNPDGLYVFADLDPGIYSIEAGYPGFKKVVRSGLELTANSTARMNLELSPGVITEIVNVAETGPLLQTDRADVRGVIEQRQVQTMPLPMNRNYQGLLMLLPGISRPYRPNSSFYNSQDSLANKVNGMGRQMNNFQLEGLDNNFDEGNTTVIVPPAESIATVDVSTSDYDPEFGRAGGAVVNVTLRSGTNQFHGSAFEFHHDQHLQARNVFAAIKAPDVYNQFGGSLGGPILKNKTFFFVDYQGSRDRLGQDNLATIPSPEFRTGDLSASPSTIYDPATGNPDGTGRAPFAGNIIPASRISPVSKKILALIPQQTYNRVNSNFENNTTFSKNLDNVDAKVDQLVGASNRFSARYSILEALVIDPGLYGIYGGPRNSGFAGRGPSRYQSSGVTYTHIFNPTLVTDARLGVTRMRNDSTNADSGTTLSQDVGIPGANISAESGGIARIVLNGYTSPMRGTGLTQPWALHTTIFSYVSNTTKTISNHILKFGSDIRRTRNEDRSPHGFGWHGEFDFDTGQTALNGNTKTSYGNSFASFLLDRPSLFGRDLSPQTPTRRELLSQFYFQDKWQVSRKLTLDLGIRYEYWPTAHPRAKGGFSYYNPQDNTLELAGLGDIPLNMGVENQKKSFGPRFGLAYRLNEKTVIRGGYGISFLPRGRLITQYNFPIQLAQSFNAQNSYSVAGSMATGFPAIPSLAIPADGVIHNPPDQNYSTVPKDAPHGYVESWNVTVQRSLPGDFSLQAAYVGNHGVNLLTGVDLNAGLIPGAGAAGQPLYQQFGRLSSTASKAGTHAYYDGLQVRLDRRFSHGFLVTTSYTYSKSISFADDNGSVEINAHLLLNRARSATDFTHIYNQSFSYELPFGPNRAWMKSGVGRWLLGDWQLNGIFSAESGPPLDITVSASSLNAPFNINRPDLNGTPTIFGAIGPGQKFFDITKFSQPAAARFGSTGRNILSGPGLANLDFSLFRKFPITERFLAELRLESFNFANTPHFSAPNVNFSSSGFGEVTTALQDQRQFQIGLRLLF